MSNLLKHSKISKILVIIAGLVLFIFFLVSLFINKKVVVSTNILIDSSPEKVLKVVSDLSTWKQWSVWNDVYYSNNNRQVIYLSNAYGEVIGSKEIQPLSTEQTPFMVKRIEKSKQKVVYEYTANNLNLVAYSTFELETDGNATKVIWTYSADYTPVLGINPLQKYFLFFTKRSLEKAYGQSLEKLKEKLSH